MAHKQIKKAKDRFIKIGSKTYQVIEEVSPTKLKVKLINIESKFPQPIGNPTPFVMDVSRLEYEEVEKQNKIQ